MENIGYKIILASNSPRRRELLAGLGYPFEVRVMEGIDVLADLAINNPEAFKAIVEKVK